VKSIVLSLAQSGAVSAAAIGRGLDLLSSQYVVAERRTLFPLAPPNAVFNNAVFDFKSSP